MYINAHGIWQLWNVGVPMCNYMCAKGHKYPAGAEMERGGVLILYSRHSMGLCVFPHKLGVLILQIISSCWWFAFFSVFSSTAS